MTKRVIGLTGGLGSGKSTVLNYFNQLGALTLDADKFVHEAYRQKKILKKVESIFGKDVFKKNGSLDREKLAAVIFSSSRSRRRLEKIIHPVVRERMATQLARSRANVAVCEVPLLFEGGLHKQYDKVIVVTAGLSIRLARLRKKGISKMEAKRRMQAQWPLLKKVKRADVIVDNNGSRSQTKKQVEKIYRGF